MSEDSKKKRAVTKREQARERWIAALSNVDWSTIDVSKYGWVGKVAEQSGIKPQKINRIIIDIFPNIYEKAFKRGVM